MRYKFCIILLNLLVFINEVCAQQPGALDSTFDGDGKAITPFQAGDARIFSMKVQNDGKIVVGGGFSY